jgi:hypothetical protein
VAASCIDNIIAITGHSLIIGIIFNTGFINCIIKKNFVIQKFIKLKGAIWWTIISCILQIFLGIVYGILIGIFLSIFRLEHAVNML